MKKIILILMLTVFGVSYSNDKFSNTIKTYNIEDINSFSLVVKNAKVKIVPSDLREITMSITSNVKLNIEKQINSQELEVKVLPPRHIFPFISTEEKTTIIMNIPKSFKKSLSILSRNGSITASKLELDLNIRTRNGSIELSDIKGSSDFISRNGKINIMNNIGNINGKTRNGFINIANTSSVKNLETYNGHINANFKVLLKNGNINTHNGRIDLNIDKLEGNNKISTYNGHITLTTKKGEFSSNSISEKEIQDISKNIILEGKNINIIHK